MSTIEIIFYALILITKKIMVLSLICNIGLINRYTNLVRKYGADNFDSHFNNR